MRARSAALLAMTACATTPGPSESGPAAASTPVLESIGDIAVLKMEVRGFDRLSTRERLLAYHLSQAAIAGDLISYDQNNPYNVAIVELCEELYRYRAALDPALVRRLHDYLRRLWIFHGVHGESSRKFVPEFSAEDLKAAVAAARKGGASLPDDAAIEALRRPIFDASFEPMNTVKNPPPGQDIVTASANNFYRGVTLKDLEGFKEHNPLNSRVVKGSNGKPVEEVYRAGGDGVAPGRYARELAAIVGHLETALPYAEPPQAEALGHLVRYFRTGDLKWWDAYNIGWLKYETNVDMILGFVEVYVDARSQKGSFEGMVAVADPDRAQAMKSLSKNALYYEQRMPYAPMYRRESFSPPVASAVEALTETGDAGPISFTGVNLPNEQKIRETHGSKNFFLMNVFDARQAVTANPLTDEFAATPEEAAEAKRCRIPGHTALIAFHEVTGHGSGKVNPRLKGDPADHVKEYYSALEEARADLIGLVHAFDPMTVAIGLLPDAKCAEAMARAYARSGLTGLRFVPEGETIEEDHARATALIVWYAIGKGALSIELRDGKTFFVIADLDAWRKATAELLAELMRIKGEGDYAAAKALTDRLAVRLNTTWRDEVLARVKKLGLPRLLPVLPPKVVAVRNAEGRIVDARLEPVASFTEFMLDRAAQRPGAATSKVAQR